MGRGTGCAAVAEGKTSESPLDASYNVAVCMPENAAATGLPSPVSGAGSNLQPRSEEESDETAPCPLSLSPGEGDAVPPLLGGSRTPSVIEKSAAGPLERFLAWCCVGCLRKVFSRTRWHYLFFISIYSVLIGPLYLNWAPLRQVLFRSGAYKWECDVNETDPTSLRYIHPDHDTCVQQRLHVGHLFTVCAAADYGFSFFGGLVMDVLGPKIASLLGSSLMLTGWVLISVSTEAIQLLIPGFVFFGLGIDMAFYGTLSVAALFPGHENAVMAVVVAMRALSYMTPVVLDSLTDVLPHLAVMLGFALLGLLPAVLIAIVYAPWKPFPKVTRPAAPTDDPLAAYPSLDLASVSQRRSSLCLYCASCGRQIAPEGEASARADEIGDEESCPAASRARVSEAASMGSPSVCRRGVSVHSGMAPVRCRACRGSESGFPEGGLVGELSADLNDEQRHLEHQLGQFAGRGAAAEGALAAAAVAVRLISGESSLVGPPAVLGESREDREERGRKSFRERVEEGEKRSSVTEMLRRLSSRELGRGAAGGQADVPGAGNANGVAAPHGVVEGAEESREGMGRPETAPGRHDAGSPVHTPTVSHGARPAADGVLGQETDGARSRLSISVRSVEGRVSSVSSGTGAFSPSLAVGSLSKNRSSGTQRGAESRDERWDSVGTGGGMHLQPPSSALSSYTMASAMSLEQAPSLRHYPPTCLGRLCFVRHTLQTHPYVVESLAFIRDFIFSPMYLPIVPYFTIALIRAVYFNDASEDLVPRTLRFLHIVLGFVFVAPPFAGVIADYCGIIVCMLLINTCGTLVIVAAFIAYQADVIFFEYVASFMFMLNMALMTNQVYFFVADTFPQRHLGKLCGFACTIGGVISLCVTAMFEFSVKTEGGFTIMLSLLMGLSVVTYFLIWLLQITAKRARREKTALAGHPQGDSEDTAHDARSDSPKERRDSAMNPADPRSPSGARDANAQPQPRKSLSAAFGLASDAV
ncbi:conserved hypothetical protein [Neospora caninum Liverpool]|uniref:Transmembrane protein n=1 Tax=Neospora caninum (strain Liverpool) TaxID=572307 RepID=F0VQQ4_NEOCL|nr:conserved hypothetical protein [Neospora caninum Liverpool]CBZ56051.1 conserved hypothetical protein [Neospora caninum Liverpool]CEL70799.1 TPA: hypothetical protein BN1204_064770 [Neospora caninum Liverpool]|eukprot:XP_003886077.1 conserved hypothetical protein [Neospora caninum Liverpool]